MTYNPDADINAWILSEPQKGGKSHARGEQQKREVPDTERQAVHR